MTATRAAAAALLAGSLLLTGCGSNAPAQPTEVEDCDAEDFANREADCGFSQKKTKTKKPTTRSTRR